MVLLLAIRGFIIREGVRTLLECKITAPKKTAEENYSCEVTASPILSESKSILGVDSEQAAVLSREFLRSLLRDYSVVDEHGNSVEI